ncbi:MAG: hypothetical protein ACYTFA_00665 [Planctomycetota bacterium]|jgi:hypothetical protein
MSGWSILIRGVVCLTGALYFLRLVAHAIADARSLLRSLEEREQIRGRHRAEAGVYLAPAATGASRDSWTDTPIALGGGALEEQADTKVDA